MAQIFGILCCLADISNCTRSIAEHLLASHRKTFNPTPHVSVSFDLFIDQAASSNFNCFTMSFSSPQELSQRLYIYICVFFAIVCFCFSICLCICVGVAPGQAYSHIGSTANATNKTKTVPAPIVHVFAKSYLKAKTDHKNGMSRFQSDCGFTKYPHTVVYTVFIVHFLCLSSTIAFQGGAKVGQICWELIMALLTVVLTDSLVLFKNKSPLGGPCPVLDRSWLP